MPTVAELREQTVRVLEHQGYDVQGTLFSLKNFERNTKRDAHMLAKAERMLEHESFVRKGSVLAKTYMVNGMDLVIDKISPTLIEVNAGTETEKLYRWWNLVWWSLPYERSYGRQMRFIVWDKYHKAPMGLIGLQSPLLSWAVRDKYLRLTSADRDFWVNQSLSAQRLGALPPYNNILGGKLVALMMTTDVVRNRFREKYENVRTILKDRSLPANLLFVTTTGAYGKSRVYSRLKINGRNGAEDIGITRGAGSFHIPNFLYQEYLTFLNDRNLDTTRGYGSGPSRKVRLIREAMRLLGFHDGVNHSVQRSVYLFPYVTNLDGVIHRKEDPSWIGRSEVDVGEQWKKRWAMPRANIDRRFFEFSKDAFVDQSLAELEQFRRLFGEIKPTPQIDGRTN